MAPANSNPLLPAQINTIDEHRAAIAPYNFVPLPQTIVPAEQQEPLDQRIYHSARHTGTISCTLTAETPLYVRCGYTPEQYAALALTPFEDLTPEQRHARAQFFSLADPNAPVIPGSSLRGMLRALVEITGYGKMEKVTNRQRYFFRAVAAKMDDPLARPYRDQLKNVKAGYITKHDGAWFIKPATTIGQESFIKVRERDVPNSVGLTRMSNNDYHLQTIAVSFTHKRTPNGRTVVDLIDRPGVHPYTGMLVTSGNMIETGGGYTNRKNHCVVLAKGTAEIPIDPDAINDYRNSLSPFQKDELGDDGVLREGRPVFYCEAARGEKYVRYFGHSPNFRLPYRFPGSQRAASPADFVPDEHRDASKIDLAEAIFGFVRPERQKKGLQALAGRVFVGDARLNPGQPDALFTEPITPQILATPKPTTFQHYLVQGSAVRPELKHYASKPGEETTARGHKLYWHQGAQPSISLPPLQMDTKDTQKTLIRPVKAGATFSFTLSFENLSDVELGALLWVLRLSADDRYRLKLGMGKPLGMGAVKITSTVTLSDRRERYEHLFGKTGWSTAGESHLSDERRAELTRAFEDYVLQESHDQSGKDTLESTLRIQCLLALLDWPGPGHEQTRYMEIERDRSDYIPAARLVKYNDPTVNEYKDRPVLPTPLQVAGLAAPERTHEPQDSLTTSRSPNQTPTRSVVTIPTIGDVITGNRNGPTREPIRGVKVKINPSYCQPAKGIEVVGIIRAEDAAGQVTGGFKGEVIGSEERGSIIYIFLKPVKKDKS